MSNSTTRIVVAVIGAMGLIIAALVTSLLSKANTNVVLIPQQSTQGIPVSAPQNIPQEIATNVALPAPQDAKPVVVVVTATPSLALAATPTSNYPSGGDCQNATFHVEDLGLWVSGQYRPMPAPPGVCEVVFAHGDINDSGVCHVKEFKTGEVVQGLGNGTFRLLRISGNSEQIKAEEVLRQQAAAASAHSSCSWLP